MLNAGIILQGQNANVFDRFLEGQQAGRQNALSDLYRTQGAAIANGDPNAINALAQFDPQAALGVKQQQFDFAQAQENARLKAEEYKRSVSAAEAAATAAEVEKAVKMGLAARSPQEWDAMVSQFAPDLVGQFENREAIAQSYMSFADILKRDEPGDPTKGAPTGYMWTDPKNPAAGVAPIPGINTGPEWRPATPQEAGAYGAQAGQINTQTGQFQAINPPRGMTIESDGAGGFRMVQGAGVGGAQTGTPTDINPFNVETMTSEIAAIMNDPNLAKVTGPIEGGGGNDVEGLNLAQRVYYGSEGLALIEKIAKLQGTTWLAARQFLKGGGPITDYESRKAESAVSRLSRVKDEKEFREALKDLQDAVTEGARKLKAATGTAAPENSPPAGGTGQPPQDFQLDPDTDALVRQLLSGEN